MARRVKQAGDGRGSTPPAEIPKAKERGERGIFRSVHRGLKVKLQKSERIDHGAGNYEIVPPRWADFEDRGSYGEYKANAEDAEILRRVIEERKNLKFPAKFTEI